MLLSLGSCFDISQPSVPAVLERSIGTMYRKELNYSNLAPFISSYLMHYQLFAPSSFTLLSH